MPSQGQLCLLVFKPTHRKFPFLCRFRDVTIAEFTISCFGVLFIPVAIAITLWCLWLLSYNHPSGMNRRWRELLKSFNRISETHVKQSTPINHDVDGMRHHGRAQRSGGQCQHYWNWSQPVGRSYYIHVCLLTRCWITNWVQLSTVSV